MKFHWPSFLLGCAAGATGVLLARQLRPVLLEIATAAYQFSDTVWARVTMLQEDVEDVLAEAKTRARRPRKPTPVRARRRA